MAKITAESLNLRDRELEASIQEAMAAAFALFILRFARREA